MLIKCPECGREISSEALSCPHCGFPINKNIAERKSIDNDKALLKQYTEEYDAYTSSGNACVIVGFIFIIIGVVFLPLSFTLEGLGALAIVSYVVIPLGLVIAIVGGSVNSTKANNRKKEIERIETKLGDINQKKEND